MTERNANTFVILPTQFQVYSCASSLTEHSIELDRPGIRVQLSARSKRIHFRDL